MSSSVEQNKNYVKFSCSSDKSNADSFGTLNSIHKNQTDGAMQAVKTLATMRFTAKSDYPKPDCTSPSAPDGTTRATCIKDIVCFKNKRFLFCSKFLQVNGDYTVSLTLTFDMMGRPFDAIN